MNKKDISEIKRLFRRDGGAIDTICGCFVDGEHQVRTTFRDAFLSLTQEETDKYFEIFRKAFSGTLGKNLHTLEYSLDQELSGNGYRLLKRLKESGLKDDAILEEFYKTAAENYAYGENYFIVLIHCNYDVPGKGTDGLDMEDASDEVYEFVLCCICPLALSEAGLYFNMQTNRVEERLRDLWIQLPMNAFLFPAFNNRGTDLHSLLYYAKKTEELHPEFLEGCIGGPTPLSYKTQKSAFQEIVAEMTGEVCHYDTVCQLQENLTELMEEHKEDPEPLKLDRQDVKRLLQNSGVKEEALERFEQVYEEAAGKEATFLAPNLVDTKSFSIKSPDITIKVNPQRMDLIQVQMLEGRRCIVIPVEDNVEINGMNVTMDFDTGEEEQNHDI